MNNSIESFYSDRNAEAVVEHPLKFKQQLKIGAKAYSYLSNAENLKDVLAAVTAMATGSTIAGAAWFAGLGTFGKIALFMA